MVEATIEDLVIMPRSSRKSDAVRRRCCIEHDFAKVIEMRASTGTEDRVSEIGSKGAQFIDAEKNGEK
jgi:hypothetical protein